MGGVVSQIAFPVPPKDEGARMLRQRPELLFLTATSGEQISAVHIRNRGAKRTILYSHGNAEDLGLCLHTLDRLSVSCNADVFAYDYLGYGISEGLPSEENCYLSIDAAYAHLRRIVQPHSIIAYGRSIGSGPTVDLVSRHPEIRGMVLQSPIESGGRVVFGDKLPWFARGLDIFRSYEKVGSVQCPVLVMHGTLDEVVPFSNGKAIHAGCKNASEPYWVPGAGHNDMPESRCNAKTREFLDREFVWSY